MKKGFTLIELLAVIVILAIIALIAVPIVLNIINDSKNSKNTILVYMGNGTVSPKKMLNEIKNAFKKKFDFEFFFLGFYS